MIGLVQLFFWLIRMMVLANIIFSWVVLAQGGREPRWLYHPAVRLIQELSFQILRPFRRLFDRVGLPTRPIDFSPMVALLALQVIEALVIRFLLGLGLG